VQVAARFISLEVSFSGDRAGARRSFKPNATSSESDSPGVSVAAYGYEGIVDTFV
jgi:hypothetical protein